MKNFLCTVFVSLLLLSCGNLKTPTLFMIGDSTMANKPLKDNPERGWGQLLPVFFDTTKIKIENHAKNGRSTRSFIYEGRWDSVCAKLKPGDFVIIQFGHNDGSIEKTERYATPVEYAYNLTRFVKDTRLKNANPILCTSIVRRKFNESGVLQDTHGEYPGIVRKIAKTLNVPLIDMQLETQKVVSELSDEKSKELFLHIPPGVYKSLPDGKTDNTHFSEKGATPIAGIAIDGIRNLHTGLEKYLK